MYIHFICTLLNELTCSSTYETRQSERAIISNNDRRNVPAAKLKMKVDLEHHNSTVVGHLSYLESHISIAGHGLRSFLSKGN